MNRPYVTIHKVNGRCVTTDEALEWLQQRLDTPLPVLSVDYARDGKIFSVTIDKGDLEIIVVILIFEHTHVTITGVDNTYEYKEE